MTTASVEQIRILMTIMVNALGQALDDAMQGFVRLKTGVDFASRWNSVHGPRGLRRGDLAVGIFHSSRVIPGLQKRLLCCRH